MKIYIDAGHNNSSYNTGAVGNGLKEQDITFTTAFKLGEILKQYGVEVILSRPTIQTNLGTDNTSAINARWKAANSFGADYFISIHTNAGGGTGAETLYYKADSKAYAQIIQNEYITYMGLKSRGIKYRDNIAVVKRTTMPAVLIELGFIDTLTDSLVLAQKQNEMAMGIAKGFISLLNLEGGGEEMSMINDTQILYNGNLVSVESILYGGYNYVKLRDLSKFGFTVGYDLEKHLPTITDQ